MLVKLGVAIEFALATFARIFFSPFLGQAGFLLLFCQLLHFFLELVLDLQLMLS